MSDADTIEISNADLIGPRDGDNAADFRDMLFPSVLKALQAELEVSVFTGSGTVVVDWGPVMRLFGAGEPPDAESVPPIEDPAFLSATINDLYLSTVYASWTTAFGGALLLRAVFEEEGVELRGNVDLDFDHIELGVYFVPTLDDNDTVVWGTELTFDVMGVPLTPGWREQLQEALLGGPIVGLLADALAALTSQLNLVLNLGETDIRSIDIDDGVARFGIGDPSDLKVDVILDAVELIDDTDGTGQGELTFAATVAGVDTGWSGEVPGGSDTVIPLEGAQWRTSLTMQPGQSVSLRFEGRDRDGKNDKSLGIVNVDLLTGDLPQVRSYTADTGNYRLLLRVEARGDTPLPPAHRHLRVTVPTVQVFRDLDTSGKGEVQFWASAAGYPTSVSPEEQVKGTQNPAISPGLSVDLYHPEGEDLQVRVIGWDNDPSQRDWLGEATLVMPATVIGITRDPETVYADSGDFQASIMVVDLGAPEGPEGPGGEPPEEVETMSRLIVFDTLTIFHKREVGAGEILATATVADQPIGGGEPIKAAAGSVIPLTGDRWSKQVEVPVGGFLTIGTKVVDVDGRVDDETQHNDELLGVTGSAFGADDDYGLGSHTAGDGDGNYEYAFRVLDPAAASAGDQGITIRFDSVEILHDRSWPNRGHFWCTATANGFPIGNSDEFEAGRGDTIVLDPGEWSKTLGVEEGGTVDLVFEVVESRDNDHDSLGVARASVAYPLPSGLQPVTSDIGDFTVSFQALDPSRTAADPLEVTFLEVTMLRDGDAISEGELRFVGTANEQTTGLSETRSIRSDELVPLVGDFWSLAPAVDADEDLVVGFKVYDQDSQALTAYDKIEVRSSLEGAWGLGEHVVDGENGKFRVRYSVAPRGDLPDVPGLVPLLVEYVSATIHDDGDRVDRGEISFTGTLNGAVALQSAEHKVKAGEAVSLGEALSARTVWVRPDQDLEVTLAAVERDGQQTDTLGTSALVHQAADDWNVGTHEVTSPGGGITSTWRVDHAAGPRLKVRFVHVHVNDDEDGVGRGKLVCEGTVEQIGTGPSLEMRAGSDDPDTSRDDIKSDLYLGGPKWIKTVSIDPDASDPLSVSFTVTEIDGLSRDDLLGTVTLDVKPVLDAAFGLQVFTETADSGRYELTCVAQYLQA